MNVGNVKDGVFYKHVRFSKAVLWKDRELSLPVHLLDKMLVDGVYRLVFIDKVKGESWEFPIEKVVKYAKIKQVGQEPQYYFSIYLRKIKKLKGSEVVEFEPTPVQEILL